MTLPIQTRAQASGEKPIRVLIVDDDEDDYRYARSLLRQIDDYVFEIDWTAYGEEALIRMQEKVYDVCLCDYRLRRLTGLDLLKQARSLGFTAPVVFLTGQDDRDIDREAVRAGASDYLVKGQLDATLLERSIRYAIAQKRSEEILRSQNAFMGAVLDNAEALVVVVSPDGRIVHFNRACEKKTGIPGEKMIGRKLWEGFLQEEDGVTVRRRFEEGLAPDQFPNQWELRVCGIEGQRTIVWSNAALTDATDAIDFVVCVGIDVTEQREAEEGLASARAHEIEIGTNIQRTLLVRQQPENLSGMSLGIYSLPSQSISGDYFDLFRYDDYRVDVLVGDVMGKGVTAGLLGAATKAQFQRAVRQLGGTMAHYDRLPEPEEIVTTVHYRLSPELKSLDSFITLAYVRFDLEKRLMTFVDCGAPPPIHYQASTGETVLLNGENMPLGMFPAEIYRQVKVPIAPGDLFVFYSDGITETYSPQEDDLFGVSRLQQCVAENATCSHDVLTERIISRIRAFTGQSDGPFDDDLTCVAVRIADTLPEKRVASHCREFTADALQVSAIREYLQEVFSHYVTCFSEDDTVLMEAGIVEAVNNIILHTYRGTPDRTIQLEIDSFPDRMQIAVLDWGSLKFTPQEIVTPIIEEMPTSGFGLYILHQCFDTVAFDRDALGRNRLMVQKWHQNTDHASRTKEIS